MAWIHNDEGRRELSILDREANELGCRVAKLEEVVQALLDLHIAHHNNPVHAAARAVLRGEEVNLDGEPMS